MRAKHVAVQAVTVDELERELADLFGAHRFDAELFADLAERGDHRSFAGIDAPAGAVHLARAEPALLLDEQDARVLAIDDEEKRRAIGGLPRAPVDVGQTHTILLPKRKDPFDRRSGLRPAGSIFRPGDPWFASLPTGVPFDPRREIVEKFSKR